MGTIGFMQGRLSKPVKGKIQAFPWTDWRSEFALAEKRGFSLMEWTLDAERIWENPLMTSEGRNEITKLSNLHGVRIESLTGDCFMQEPFYKAVGDERIRLIKVLKHVILACVELSIRLVVVPLVDNGRLENENDAQILSQELMALESILLDGKISIVFESDFPPAILAEFISRFPADQFGINYDIGNSASLGFDPSKEIAAYGTRVYNVHIKDRIRGGGTVPLGTGNANCRQVFRYLRKAGYSGNFILQTARASDGDHVGTLCRYRDMVDTWLGEASLKSL